MAALRINFLFPLVWAAVFFLIDLYWEDPEVLEHKKTAELKKTSWLYVLVVIAPLIYFATTRDWFADTSAYLTLFRSMPDSPSGIQAYMSTVVKDHGFFFLSCVIRAFITQDTVIYLAIIAALQGLALAVFFRRYSAHFAIALFLFIVSTDFISWMYNGMRQFTAVCIILFATPYILKKKYVPAILLILLASTMHQTVLLMIPFIFIAQGKAWNYKTLLYIVGVIIVVAYIGNFTTLLDDALANTQYSDVIENYQEWGDDGTNPIRVLVYALPTILAFIARPYIEYENDPVINLSVNMSILTTGLYVISMFSSGLTIGRLPIYTSLFNYILLPWEIDHCFSEGSRKILYVGMLAAYLVYFYYQMHIIWGYI